MDYNLKKENRKKFQDKQRLKRHHKKDYSKVVKDEDPAKAEEVEEEVQLEANDWRYDNELQMEYEGELPVMNKVSDKSFDDYHLKKPKDVKSMSIDELNKQVGKIKVEKSFDEEFLDLPVSEEVKVVAKSKKLESHVPKGLAKDQDFLDDLLGI